MSSDENYVLVPGYRLRWNISTFLRLLLFFGSIFILCFLLSKSEEITSVIVYILVITLVLLLAVLLHIKTKILFSLEKIKISYGWLPFFRTRKTKHLKNIYIEYSEYGDNDSVGGGFSYLVLDFTKERKIKIIIDSLTREEREQITTRLSSLRYKYSDQQFNIS